MATTVYALAMRDDPLPRFGRDAMPKPEPEPEPETPAAPKAGTKRPVTTH